MTRCEPGTQAPMPSKRQTGPGDTLKAALEVRDQGGTLLTKTAVQEHGWSPSMVDKLLGVPDLLRSNPHSRKAAPMRLYALDRVAALEQGADFVAMQAVARKRAGASKLAADARRQSLLDEVLRMVVTVDRLPLDLVMHLSLVHWEKTAPEHRSDDIRDGSNADQATRDRWAVNYLRHCRSHYDHMLEDVAGKVGVDEAARAIRAKVYDAIAAEWPALADECHRKKTARSG